MSARLALIIGPILIYAGSTLAGMPDWAKSSGQRLEGGHFIVACHGIGPDLDLARKAALESCRSSAQEQIVSDFKVKSLSVEDQRQVAFHQEITTQVEVKGLKCDPKQEQVDQEQDSFGVWLQCDFNLATAKSKPVREEANKLLAPSASWVGNPEELNPTGVGADIKGGRYITSERKSVTLSTVPQCSDVLIRGVEPARIVLCKSNPVILMVGSDDKELVVRAKDHLPKTVKLSDERSADAQIQVILDKAE